MCGSALCITRLLYRQRLIPVSLHRYSILNHKIARLRGPHSLLSAVTHRVSLAAFYDGYRKNGKIIGAIYRPILKLEK